MWIKRSLLSAYLLARLPLIWLIKVLGSPFIRDAAGRARILIIRLDRLGDYVLTLPVIENLRNRYPDADISILVKPYLAGIARLTRSVDEVIVYDGFVSTVRRLRDGHFSLAIDMLCDYTLKSALLAFFSGAATRAGFAGGFRELLFTQAAKPGKAPRRMAAINLDILKILGVPVVVTEPRMAVEGVEKSGKAVVAIHPGGHYPSQRWAPERFAAVGSRILDAYDVRLVVLGGPDDRASAEGVIKRLGEGRVEAVFPDLKGLAAILAQSALLICNNSGPLHLAAALGTATVSLMGPTDPVLWWPQGPGQIVIRKEIPCSPCTAGRCGSHACMDLITADEVFEKAKGVLEKIDGIRKR